MITQFILFGIRLLTIVSAPLKRETPLAVGAEGLGWWHVEGAEVLASLHAVAAGEDPSLVFAELYANSGTFEPDTADTEDDGLF